MCTRAWALARGSWAVRAAWADGAGLASATRLLSPFLFSSFFQFLFYFYFYFHTAPTDVYMCCQHIYTLVGSTRGHLGSWGPSQGLETHTNNLFIKVGLILLHDIKL